jgi:hypothetical protein
MVESSVVVHLFSPIGVVVGVHVESTAGIEFLQNARMLNPVTPLHGLSDCFILNRFQQTESDPIRL